MEKEACEACYIKGKAEGKAEGLAEGKLKIANTMLSLGLAVTTIAQ